MSIITIILTRGPDNLAAIKKVAAPVFEALNAIISKKVCKNK